MFRGTKKICKESLLVGSFYFKVIVYYFEYLINHFAVTSLLINIHFLELPLSGDVSCVAGKININGTMTTVLRSCTDQLRVLCEPNGVDVTVDATTSSTVTVQSGNNNATKTNHKITNLGIGNQTS